MENGNIFTKTANENIAKCGNVWGVSQEYDFKFDIKIFNRIFCFERRSAKSFMGRHGGGWNVNIGVQAGSWGRLIRLLDVIISFGGTSVRIKKHAR